MAITLTPYFNLRAFRLGESIVFSNLSNLKCYFTQNGDDIDVEVSLCGVLKEYVLPNCQDLAVMDFPNSFINFDADAFYEGASIANIYCPNVANDRYTPDEAYFALDISNLMPTRNGAILPAQSPATLEEIEFIKRAIGENRSDVEYQVIDLNLILSGLESYIKDKLITPIDR